MGLSPSILSIIPVVHGSSRSLSRTTDGGPTGVIPCSPPLFFCYNRGQYDQTIHYAHYSTGQKRAESVVL